MSWGVRFRYFRYDADENFGIRRYSDPVVHHMRNFVWQVGRQLSRMGTVINQNMNSCNELLREILQSPKWYRSIPEYPGLAEL